MERAGLDNLIQWAETQMDINKKIVRDLHGHMVAIMINAIWLAVITIYLAWRT